MWKYIYSIRFIAIVKQETTSQELLCAINRCLIPDTLYVYIEFIHSPILNMGFVLRFYGPVNPMGSCRAWSVYLTTRLLGRLSPLSG